jgi:hypothetical protein
MLKENLKDAAQILQNILTQSVVTEEAEETSLLKAAQNFASQDPENSDLSKILKNMTKFKDPTETLIRELDLLLDDIQVK